MKAKDYFIELKECHHIDTITVKVEDIYERMVKELDDLMKRRNANKHRPENMIACIKEIDNKWRALMNLWEKYRLSDEATTWQREVMLNDNFVEKLIEERESYKQYYPYLRTAKYKELLAEYEAKREKENEELRKRLKEQQKDQDLDSDDHYFHFHKVIPLEEITEENITREILACLGSLGSFSRTGLSLECAKPLAARITLLRHWKNSGIDKSEIPEFEKDPFGYTRKYVM